MNAPFTLLNTEFPAVSGAASIRASLAALHDAIRDLEAGAELLAEERRRDIRHVIEAAGAEFGRAMAEPALRLAYHRQISAFEPQIGAAGRALVGHLAALAVFEGEDLRWTGSLRELSTITGFSHEGVLNAVGALQRNALLEAVTRGNGSRRWTFRLLIRPEARHNLTGEMVLGFVRRIEAATSAPGGG